MTDAGHRRHLEAELRWLRWRLLAGQAPTPTDGGDLADRTIAQEQRVLTHAARESIVLKARAIVGALRRMDAGTFGICEACAEPIGKKRLDAMPWAAKCYACQCETEREDERRRSRRVIDDQTDEEC